MNGWGPEKGAPFFGVDRAAPASRFTRSLVRRGFVAHVVAFLREMPSHVREAWGMTRWEQ